MLGSDRLSFYRTCIASPPLTPSNAPVKVFDSPNGAFKLRVPPDEAALADLVKQAHAACAGAPDYEAAMRAEVARLLDARPVFWSKVWPAGLALGRYLLRTGRSGAAAVLGLGAGIGVCEVCAAIAGASDTVATDIEPNGLEYFLASAVDNGVGNRVRSMPFDWNKPIPKQLGGPFDVLLAGDTLYQDEHAPALGMVIPKLVKRGGAVVFSDSLERPYKEGHHGMLAKLLERAGFRQKACHDIAVDAPTGGVAAGKQVRVLVYERS